MMIRNNSFLRESNFSRPQAPRSLKHHKQLHMFKTKIALHLSIYLTFMYGLKNQKLLVSILSGLQNYLIPKIIALKH